MRIAVLIDRPRYSYLPNEEGAREDRQKQSTAENVYQVLSKYFECMIIQADENLLTQLKANDINFVFNLCNGIWGESKLAQVPAFLEFAGIPYTGSPILGHSLSLNKIYTSKVLKNLGLNTPNFSYVYTEDELESLDVTFPVIVKPCDEGSSRGIHQNSLVFDMKELRDRVVEGLELSHPPMMISEFIDGREFHVGVLGNGDDLHFLPIEEICLDGLPDHMHRFYSFEVKAHYKDKTSYQCPANLDEGLTEKMQEIAKRTFKALHLRDYARLDIRLKGDEPYVLEVNSLPGLMKGYSALTRMASAQRIDYDDLILKILFSAFKRYNINLEALVLKDIPPVNRNTAS